MKRTIVALSVLLVLAVASPARAAPEDWLEIDYSELVDRRQLSHSGESVGMLLARLGGRPLPRAGERPSDLNAHVLLDPLLEPFAFVLPDAIDSLRPIAERPWIEIAGLWPPGGREPAWVELLRARRFVVESDGAGKMRVFVPAPAGAEAQEAGVVSRAAWDEAWPVLRLVLAAERTRLGLRDKGIDVSVFTYVHRPERLAFSLLVRPLELSVDDTRPDGKRPPVDFEALERFLAADLRLEGGRLEPDGSLRLLGSASGGSTLLGRKLSVSDFAVAYRSVFHGGLSEPYMSLDRGFSPQTSVVNYGGRLRDTALGMVSLLCDIRFKTFSVGLDITTGADRRVEVREQLSGFRTHLERFAADAAAGRAGQQTRFWFYPDTVDLTVSPEGDALVFRRVRMAAASERVGETGLRAAGGEDPPWTRETIARVNRDYDTLAGIFPELADLDVVVRLLSLFTWLRQAERDGRPLPELDALLAVELPPIPSPRTFPQMLAYQALPPAGSTAAVEAFDRATVGEALERLNPAADFPFTAERRFRRAVGWLDRNRADQAALAAELRQVDVGSTDPSSLDLLAYRAERLHMHRRVLDTLSGEPRNRVSSRVRAGEQLRIFSVGIGGIDLGMQKVIERSRGRAATSRSVAEPGTPAASRDGWRVDPAGLPRNEIPAHGPGIGAGRRVESDPLEEGRRGIRVLLGVDWPEMRGRTLVVGKEGRAEEFGRIDGRRRLNFRWDASPGTLAAKRGALPAPITVDDRPAGELPMGLMILRLVEVDAGSPEPSKIPIEIGATVQGAARWMRADFPRPILQRLVLGREVDRTPGAELSGLSPLPSSLSAVETVMVQGGASRWEPPWRAGSRRIAGEEDPTRVARALDAWWAAEASPGPSGIVGVDGERSIRRWAGAPRPGAQAPLWLVTDDATTPGERLARSWSAGPVVDTLPGSSSSPLVIVVSDESPSVFSERLRNLSRDPALRGKLLAAWSLSGPLREDLPAVLLAEGNLAGFGLADASLGARREVSDRLAALARALGEAAGGTRVERLRGPFLWHF